MSAGHTRGPWKARFENVRYVIFVDGEIGEKALATTGGAYPDSEANAKLIASAPELLEALQMLVADFGDYPASERPCLAFDKARAAIARATDQGEMK